MTRWWAFLALCPLGACEGDTRACYPADFRACECADGKPGYAQCDAEGASYGECGYCGTTPGLAASTGVGGGAGGAGGGEPLLPFMAPCEEDIECETGLCYPFATKGPHCSQPCDGPEDCPAPSPGCNGMGICKAP